MFEAEVEMEKRSSVLPLLLMLCLVAAIAGLVGYVILQAKGQTPVTAQEASVIVAAAVNGSGSGIGPGPAVIQFRTGFLKPSADVKPEDPNYRLLEKAGIVKLAKPVHGNVAVSITPEGERLLTGLPGFKKEKKSMARSPAKFPSRSGNL